MARYEDRDRDGGQFMGGGQGGPGGDRDGGPFNRGRPLHRRPVTDYGTPVAKWMMDRSMEWRGLPQDVPRPALPFVVDLLPPAAYPDNPSACLPTKHIHASLNKIKHPINVVKWTPEGRRLLTGSSSGEFTLWNGMGFNFETIMQAHDCAIRVCEYSHGGDWLLSGDQDGIVKYWQPNFNNVKILQAHTETVRDLSFSPSDAKFVTASDDGTLKLWNFNEGVEERTFTGHGWDVKSVDWHPTKGLIVSGSKDHLVKLWDPRTARCLTTLHGHKNTISKTIFQPSRGDLLATCARDQTCRIFDLRAMKDFAVLRGHEKDISALAWHPTNPGVISTGGSDGSMNHYLIDEIPGGHTNASNTVLQPAASLPWAHEYAIWSMEYHPLGHILCTGSNDRITRFWTRPRPGESDGFKDRYHIGEEAAMALGTYDRNRKRHRQEEEEQEEQDEADALEEQKMPALPGLANAPPFPMSIPGFLPPPPMPLGSNVPPPPIPGMNTSGPPPPPMGLPGMPGLQMPGMPGLDLSNLAKMFPGMPLPPPPGQLPPGMIPPPLPGFGMPGMPIPGMTMPPVGPGIPGLAGGQGGQGGQDERGLGGRSRAPLPTQKDSLREAQIKGAYRVAR